MQGLPDQGLSVHPVLSAAHAFTQSLADLGDLDRLLYDLTVRAAHALGAVGAGVMLQDATGRLSFAAASTLLVEQVERLQDELQEGPCVSAFRTDEAVIVHELDPLSRWPRYAVRARQLGVRGVIGIPMRAHGRTIGVINVYRAAPDPWSDEDVEASGLFAAMAAAYLLHAGELRASQRLNDNLRRALASRGVIERAKGIVMHRDDVDEDEAFELLRQHSMSSHRKLRDVAAEVIADAEGSDRGEPDRTSRTQEGRR